MDNLKRIRKEQGMTQKQLAENSGISIRMIQKYEQNDRDINLATAISVSKLASALGCSSDDLLEPNTIIYDKKRFGYLVQDEVKFSYMCKDIIETNELRDFGILDSAIIFTEYVYSKENEIRYCYEVIHRNREEWLSEMFFSRDRLTADYFFKMYSELDDIL